MLSLVRVNSVQKFKTSQLRYNTLVAESILNAQRLRPTFVDRDSDIEV